jgi:hypothetical protein
LRLFAAELLFLSDAVRSAGLPALLGTNFSAEVGAPGGQLGGHGKPNGLCPPSAYFAFSAVSAPLHLCAFALVQLRFSGSGFAVFCAFSRLNCSS